MLKIEISDYRNYDENTCRNGGNYAFYTTYVECANGKFRVEYGTSADFEYCPCCGTFINGNWNHWCNNQEDPWTYVSKEEAMQDYEEVQSLHDEDYVAEIIDE